VAAALALAALLALACAGGAGTDDSKLAERLLLTKEDMPFRWQVSDPTQVESTSALTQRCGDPNAQDRSASAVSPTFTSGAIVVTQVVSLYRTEGAATSRMSALDGVIRCRWEFMSNGEANTPAMTIAGVAGESLRIANYGDATRAYRTRYRSGNPSNAAAVEASVIEDLIYVRVERASFVVRILAVDSTLDQRETERIVSAATARVRAELGD
jgi:hypothetical protein